MSYISQFWFTFLFFCPLRQSKSGKQSLLSIEQDDEEKQSAIANNDPVEVTLAETNESESAEKILQFILPPSKLNVINGPLVDNEVGAMVRCTNRQSNENLRIGDRILAVDGEDVKDRDVEEIARIVAAKKNTFRRITVCRKKRKKKERINVQLLANNNEVRQNALTALPENEDVCQPKSR